MVQTQGHFFCSRTDFPAVPPPIPSPSTEGSLHFWQALLTLPVTSGAHAHGEGSWAGVTQSRTEPSDLREAGKAPIEGQPGLLGAQHLVNLEEGGFQKNDIGDQTKLLFLFFIGTLTMKQRGGGRDQLTFMEELHRSNGEQNILKTLVNSQRSLWADIIRN